MVLSLSRLVIHATLQASYAPSDTVLLISGIVFLDPEAWWDGQGCPSPLVSVVIAAPLHASVLPEAIEEALVVWMGGCNIVAQSLPEERFESEREHWDQTTV